jgi:hypothetical protein
MIVNGGKDAEGVRHPGTHRGKHLRAELQTERMGEAHGLDIEWMLVSLSLPGIPRDSEFRGEAREEDAGRLLMAHNTVMNERRITQRGRGNSTKRRFIDFYAAFI